MPRYIDADIAHEMLLRGYEIKDVPTADVQEVRHGKWKTCGEFDDFAKCSCCSYQDTAYHVFCNDFKYCPMCGAKMD